MHSGAAGGVALDQARAAYTPLMKHPPPHLAAQQAGHVRLASGLPRVRLVGQGGVNLSKSERNHTFLTEAQVWTPTPAEISQPSQPLHSRGLVERCGQGPP